MNKIIKSLKIYNQQYNINKLPEYLDFNLENKISGFIKSADYINSLSKIDLRYSDLTHICDKNDLRDGLITNNLYMLIPSEYVCSSQILVFKNDIHDYYDSITIMTKEESINNLYIKYELFDKIETVNLNSLLLLSKINGTNRNGSQGKYVHTIDKYDNISQIRLIIDNNLKKTFRMIIRF